MGEVQKFSVLSLQLFCKFKFFSKIKNILMIQQTKKSKHITIDTEKSFDKLPQPFRIKILSKLTIEISQLDKHYLQTSKQTNKNLQLTSY